MIRRRWHDLLVRLRLRKPRRHGVVHVTIVADVGPLRRALRDVGAWARQIEEEHGL